jgi:hypothetical protein
LWSRLRLVGVSVCLIILVLVSLAYWVSIENQSISRLEPTNLYFLNNIVAYSFFNDTYMNVWNSIKNLQEISDLSRVGNYSVLIYWHAYRKGPIGYTEWFVLASTLEPDKNGFIHQVSLRLNHENLTLIASYEQTLSYNLTSVENGTKTIQDFISQVPTYEYMYITEQDFHNNYPFLILLDLPSDFGITTILNQETGKIMISATSIWMGNGGLVYPENIPNLGSINSP